MWSGQCFLYIGQMTLCSQQEFKKMKIDENYKIMYAWLATSLQASSRQQYSRVGDFVRVICHCWH